MNRFPLFRPLLSRLPLRYVIADRHKMVCEGLVSLLSDCAELECVARISDGDILMKTLCTHKPDIFLTGLLLKEVSPLAIIRQCRRCMPDMGIIVLSMMSHPLAVNESASAGADAFVSKDRGYHELLETIFRVAIGQRRLFPKDTDFLHPQLTNVERTVLSGITLGKTTKEIGDEIDRSIKTVEMHRTRLLERFGVRKSTNLVRITLDSGIINSENTDSRLCQKSIKCESNVEESIDAK